MPRPLLDPALVERLRLLELRVRRRVDGALTGRHRSPTRGASVEFAEHQEYSPGAELRHVDWRVLGRLDRIMLKRFEERTELRTVLAVDASRSMGYRGARARAAKIDLALSLAAALAHVLAHQGDPVGLHVFPSDTDALLPPSARPAHLLEILDRLSETEPGGRSTDLDAALQRAARGVRRRGLVVVLSDLYDFTVDPRTLLSWLRRRHEVFVFAIVDPDEEDLPWDSPAILEALEGTGRVKVDPDALREAYRAEVARFRGAWSSAASETGVRLHFLRTDLALEDHLGVVFGASSAGHRRVA